MKRFARILTVAVVLIALWLLSAILSGRLGVFSVGHAKFVYSINTERFEAVADQMLEAGNYDSLTVPNGVKSVEYYGTRSGCVDFWMGGAGLVPASSYWGIVFTVEDEPVGFQGVDLEYTWDGEGWYWHEENGDNRCCVTKLSDHWYLYQMWF